MNPARPPRPIVLHWLVDSAVAFLATVVVALFLEVSIWVIVVVALVLGAAATPLTHRAEERALAERTRSGVDHDWVPSDDDEDPGTPPTGRS